MTTLVSFFDTATEPTEAMRDAMRAAVVGDDVYGRDPTVNALERRVAELLGKETALLLPSGTMANLAAIMAQTARGEAVLLDRDSHIARAEAGGVAVVAGCMPLEVQGRRAADVEARLAPLDDHRPVARLLCVENTHNRAGGIPVPPEAMGELRHLCDRWDLRLHVDGARLLNAAVALDAAPAELAADADSVCIALSKGLGAPVGSLLAGSRDLITRARRIRKLLGGGMRQAGVLAAAGLVALDDWRSRLREDHARAARLARLLAREPGVRVEPAAVVTNIVLCEVRAGAAELSERLLARGVACSTVGEHGLRFVLHGQIGDPEIDRLVDALAEALHGRAVR